MGTLGVSDVIVHLSDLTQEEVLDSDTISFSGLPGTGYECDDVEVAFSWLTDSDDIGIHILRMKQKAFPANPILTTTSQRRSLRSGQGTTQALFWATPGT